MLNFLVRRLGSGALSLLVIAALVFLLLKALPGGPFDTEKSLPPEIMRNIEAYYGLDRPLWEQFVRYVGNALQGDLGVSYSQRDLPVVDLIAQRLPISLELGFYAILFGLLFGLPLGVLAAAYHNRLPDYVATLLAVLGTSIPNLVLAPMLILFFGLFLKWLPIARWTTWDSKLLPTLALGLSIAAVISRLTRSSMLQIIQEDFIRTARAKGVPEHKVIFKHSLKGGMLPVVNFLGPAVAGLISGSFVVETIFQIPGLGRHFVNAAFNRDYTMIMGTVLFYAILIVLFNLVVDIIQAAMNPRLRLHD